MRSFSSGSDSWPCAARRRNALTTRFRSPSVTPAMLGYTRVQVPQPLAVKRSPALIVTVAGRVNS